LQYVVASATPTLQVRSACATAAPDEYAEVFLRAWLRRSTDEPTTAQARLVQAMARGTDLPPGPPMRDRQTAHFTPTAARG
jgi:hypothetical protein